MPRSRACGGLAWMPLVVLLVSMAACGALAVADAADAGYCSPSRINSPKFRRWVVSKWRAARALASSWPEAARGRSGAQAGALTERQADLVANAWNGFWSGHLPYEDATYIRIFKSGNNAGEGRGLSTQACRRCMLSLHAALRHGMRPHAWLHFGWTAPLLACPLAALPHLIAIGLMCCWRSPIPSCRSGRWHTL